MVNGGQLSRYTDEKGVGGETDGRGRIGGWVDRWVKGE